MSSGINSQVNRYRAAVGKRNRGSDPSPAAKQNAAKTSLGQKSKGTISKSKRNARAESSGTQMKGSWEGYQSGSSTHIQMSGRGYDGTRTARRNPRQSADFSADNSSSNPLDRDVIGQNIFDYTYKGSAGNSIRMLDKRTKLNKFRK